MPDWYRTADSETSGGNPTQWYTEDGMQFMVAYIRFSGPNDSETPRRVVVLESHPAVAEHTAKQVLALADPSFRIRSRVEARVAAPVSTSV